MEYTSESATEMTSVQTATIEAADVVAQDLTPEVRSPSNGDKHVDIDIIDKCNLQCPTCWRGVAAQKNTSATMPLSKFREIVSKLRAEGYTNVALINWTEPFLCKTLHEYVPVVKQAGLDCWLSSNLSLPPSKYLPTIISALSSGVDILWISVSGFTQSVYEINHKGGRIDWIKSNLEAISSQLRLGKIKTSVWIRYLEFPYNSNETALWEDYAKSIKIGFNAVTAWGDPKTPQPGKEIFEQHIGHRIGDFDASKSDIAFTLREFEPPAKVCTLVTDRLALDAKGDVYLCCAYPNSEQLRIGSYVDIDEHDLLLRRHTHRFCDGCEVPRRDATAEDRERFQRAWSSYSRPAST